jgi:2-oxoglutarate ferredoxin oxidoreductase subunit beta
MSRPDLQVWVVTGDGDGLSIGGNHLIHVLRRNVDLKILLFNNRIYGLTKGQYSPTSEIGKKTKSTPFGSIDHPFTPLSVALGADASFVARTIDTETQHMQGVLKKAAEHKGSAFIEIYQNCNVFNDGAFDYVTDKETKTDTQLVLEHGKPMIFGKDKNKGIRLTPGKLEPEVVTLGENGVTVNELLVHDEKEHSGALAFLLSRLSPPEFPTALGVVRNVERPAYDQLSVDQEQAILAKKGKGDLAKLLHAGETWRIS